MTFEELYKEVKIIMARKQKEERFWILWQFEHYTPPTVKFYSFLDAKKCAERMAREHKTYFYVLKVEGVVRPTQPPVEYLKIGGK